MSVLPVAARRARQPARPAAFSARAASRSGHPRRWRVSPLTRRRAPPRGAEPEPRRGRVEKEKKNRRHPNGSYGLLPRAESLAEDRPRPSLIESRSVRSEKNPPRILTCHQYHVNHSSPRVSRCRSRASPPRMRRISPGTTPPATWMAPSRGTTCATPWVAAGRSGGERFKGTSGVALPGRLHGILGPSGSGKTTLLNILAGRVRERRGAELSGDVTHGGEPLHASGSPRGEKRGDRFEASSRECLFSAPSSPSSPGTTGDARRASPCRTWSRIPSSFPT